MKKNTNLCIDLKTVMHSDALLERGKCYVGVLTRINEEKFRFEEAVRKGRPARNPKLFDGNYISMVRKQNGKYQIHMKTMAEKIDRVLLPYAIFNEVKAALQIID